MALGFAYPDLWAMTAWQGHLHEQEQQRPTPRHSGCTGSHRALGGPAARLRDLPLARRQERQGAACRGGDSLSRALPPRAARVDRGRMGHLRARPARAFLPAEAGGGVAARGRGSNLRRVRRRGFADPAAAVRLLGRGCVTAQESRLRRLLRSRVLGPSIVRQVDEELDLHLELLVRELVAEGLDERAARREAAGRLGDRQALAAACGRQARGTERRLRWSIFVDEVRQDITYALRQLARARSFTAMALLMLAAGLGATTALFSVVEGVVLRRFPFAHPARTVLVAETWNDADSSFSAGNYVDLAAGTRSFSALAALQFTPLNLADGPEPARVLAARVTGGFFEVLGVRPILGRTFGAAETESGEGALAVLSHPLWAARLGADPAIVGKTIHLSNQAYRVVGVMPERFDPTASHEDLWLPLVFTPAQRAQHDEHYLSVIGLLRPGTSAQAAQAELGVGMRRLAPRFPPHGTRRARARAPPRPRRALR